VPEIISSQRGGRRAARFLPGLLLAPLVSLIVPAPSAASVPAQAVVARQATFAVSGAWVSSAPILSVVQGDKAAIDARLKARPAQPYFVYTRTPFEDITPGSVPTLEEVKAGPAVSLSACPDEIEPASVIVYTAKDLKDATVRIGTFATATKNALAPGSIDVRVVRRGAGANPPLLLMKDDRQALTGPVPAVRLTGDPQTDIEAGTSKQFWVTVKVGKNQKPGTYKGNLSFSAPGVKPTTIPLSIEVLDLPMRSAFLQYSMDFRSLLSAVPGVPGGQVVTPDVFALHLANIRDHGFKNIMLYDRPEGLQTAIKLYKEAGMNPLGPLFIGSVTDPNEAATVEGLRNASGYRNEELAIFYRLPDGASKDFTEAVRQANRNARFVATTESSAAFQTLSGNIGDEAGEMLAPIYPIEADYTQQLLRDGKRPPTIRNVDYWTWSIPSETPLRNRLYAGFLLYSTGKSGSGVYGAFTGPYQFVPEGSDPFAAFSGGGAADPATGPQMTTYPVQGGVLDTLQWEAVREGIDDIRYIGIMKGFIRDLKDLKVSKEVTDAAESYLFNLVSKPLMTQTAAQLQANRRGIVREALKMKSILQPARPAPKPRVTPKRG
jgi:hypothetical protein